MLPELILNFHSNEPNLVISKKNVLVPSEQQSRDPTVIVSQSNLIPELMSRVSQESRET